MCSEKGCSSMVGSLTTRARKLAARPQRARSRSMALHGLYSVLSRTVVPVPARMSSRMEASSPCGWPMTALPAVKAVRTDSTDTARQWLVAGSMVTLVLDRASIPGDRNAIFTFVDVKPDEEIALVRAVDSRARTVRPPTTARKERSVTRRWTRTTIPCASSTFAYRRGEPNPPRRGVPRASEVGPRSNAECSCSSRAPCPRTSPEVASTGPSQSASISCGSSLSPAKPDDSRVFWDWVAAGIMRRRGSRPGPMCAGVGISLAAAMVGLGSASAQTNRPPVLLPLPNSTTMPGQTVTFTAMATDPDNDPLTFFGAGLPAGATLLSSGVFSWTPDFAQGGTYIITVGVSDGQLVDTATFAITVLGSNRAPVFQPMAPIGITPGQRITFTVWVTDPDGDPFTLSAMNLPPGATFDVTTGVFDWVPEACGNYPPPPVMLAATDIGMPPATGTLDVSFTYARTNNAPVIHPVGPFTIAEGMPLTFAILVDEPDCDPFTVLAMGVPEGAIFDGARLELRWTPDFDQAGVYRARLVAVDPFGLRSEERIVLITVLDTNRAPELLPLDPITVIEGDAVSFTLVAIDPDGDRLTYAALDTAAGDLDEGTGAFTWQTPSGWAGSRILSFIATDDGIPPLSSVPLGVEIVSRARDDAPMDEGRSSTPPPGGSLEEAQGECGCRGARARSAKSGLDIVAILVAAVVCGGRRALRSR